MALTARELIAQLHQTSAEDEHEAMLREFSKPDPFFLRQPPTPTPNKEA